MRRFRPCITYANVTATLALFIALGGGAYAAATLPVNSVGTKQLKKNAVQRSDIKKNAVNGSKVLSDSLTGADIRESALAKVPAATLADTAASATNASHAAAATALDKATYKSATGSAPPSPTENGAATATCDAGQRVVGGGVRVDDPINAFVVDAYPDTANTAWTARVGNAGVAAVGFTVYAICTSFSTIG